MVKIDGNLYSAPPKTELFCKCVSWMCNQSLTPPFASLRLCDFALNRERKGAKNKSPHGGDRVWVSWALVTVHSWSDRPYNKRSSCRVPEYNKN